MDDDRDAAWSFLCRHCGIEVLLLQLLLMLPMLFWRPIATALMLDGLTQIEIVPRLGIANFAAMCLSALVAVVAFIAGMWQGRAHWIVLAAAEAALAFGHAQAMSCMLPYING